MKKGEKKEKEHKKKKEFYSVTEVEREFMPDNVAKKRQEASNDTKEKMGSKMMSEILKLYLN